MKTFLIAISICSLLATRAVADGRDCEIHMINAAANHGVPLGILYAVGLTETGRQGSLHPYALNVDGRPYYPKNRDAALSIFHTMMRTGARNIDVGCMQISHRYHAKRFSSLVEMFNPARNVAYAAQFLKRLHTREGNWTKAVARYHAGPTNRPAHKRYVCKVILNMVATGFASWTDDSKNLCRD